MFFFSRRRGFLVLGLATGLLPLLPSHADRLLGSLAGAGVGVRPLTRDGEAPAVTDPLIRGDLDLPLDVLGHVAAEVPLDLVGPVDPLADPNDLFLGQIADLPAAVQVQRLHGLAGAGGPDPV